MSKKEEKKETTSNIYHTMAQSGESQETSQQLSELEELKQDAEAPKIPGFMLLKPIGHGAYAQVWEGIQVRTRRFCAVKVYHHRSGVNWLFLQREVERLLKLDKHPNIVSLLDADFTSDPAYYVMDLAQEGSLEKLIGDRRPEEITSKEINRTVTWMEEIGNALNYVHAKQMIHCDLKPANVLLDEEGHIRVADFGHARVMSESGSALGTLFYMAPEQAVVPDVNTPLQPDVRWDIYAYGCTAYALLGGHVAHAEIGPELEKTPVIEDRLKIYREAIKSSPVPDLFTLTKGKVDKDLSAIVEKCMKSNPEERYRSIAEVLKDLKNRHEGKPVSPLAHIPAYWMSKYAKLYRVTLLVAFIALAGLAAAFIFAQQRQQSEVANKAFDDILRGREFLDKDDQASAVVFFADSNKIYSTALARGDASLNMPPIPAQVFAQNSAVEAALFSPDGQSILTAGENSGINVWSSDGSKQLLSVKTDGLLKAFALSSNGSWTAAGDDGGEVKLLNLKNGKISPTINVGQEITDLAFSPDEKSLLAASADGLIHVFNTTTAQPQKNVIKTGGKVIKAVFNNDGHRILTLDKEGLARLWDMESAGSQGDPMTISVKDEPNWYIPDMAYGQDGKNILISDWSGSINFYDKDGHHQGRIYLDGTGAHFVMSPNGGEFLTSSISQGVGQAKLWTLKGRRPSKFVFKHTSKILALGFSRDGKQAITAGADRVARIWDNKTGKPVGRALWHGDAINIAALNGDGKLALTGGKDGLVRLWNLAETETDKIEIQWKKSGRSALKNIQAKAVMSHDGKEVLTYGGLSAALWETQTGKSLGALLKHSGTVLNAVFSPDDSKLLTGCGDKQACLWDLSSSQYKPLAAQGPVQAVAFSSDGSVIAAGSDDKTVRLWKTSDAAAWGIPIPCGFKAENVSFSADNKGLLAQSSTGALAYFSLPYAAGSKPAIQIAKGIQAAVLSSDNRLVAASINGIVQIFDTSNGKPKEKTLKQDHPINLLVLSPDDKTLLSLASDGEGQLWSIETGQAIGSALHHNGAAKQAIFSPKGDGLAVAYSNGGLQFWDAKTGEPIGIENQPGSSTQTLRFLADGSGLIWLGKNAALQTINTSWLSSTSDQKGLILQAEVAGQSPFDRPGFS